MKEKFEYPEEFIGLWIPKEIYLDDELNLTYKIILSEIYSLSSKNPEGCYASNKYLASFCRCSESAVTNAISDMKAMGYLSESKSDGRKRWIQVSLEKGFEKSKPRKALKKKLEKNSKKSDSKDNKISESESEKFRGRGSKVSESGSENFRPSDEEKDQTRKNSDGDSENFRGRLINFQSQTPKKSETESENFRQINILSSRESSRGISRVDCSQSINTPEEEYKESKYEEKEEDSISINKGDGSDTDREEEITEMLSSIAMSGRAFPYGFDIDHKIDSVEELKKILVYFCRKYYSFFHEDALPEITWEKLYEIAELYCVEDGILYDDSVYHFREYKEMIDLYFNEHENNDGKNYGILRFMKKSLRERLYRETQRQRKEDSGMEQYRTPPTDFPGCDSEDYGELPFE